MVHPISALVFFIIVGAAMIAVRAGAVQVVQLGGIPAAMAALAVLFATGAIFSRYFED